MEAKDLLAGMIGRTLYVVHSEPVAGVDPAQGAVYFTEHLRHIIEWEKSGILFGSGPYLQDGKVSSRAMYILRASSLEEARAIASEEPLHKHGIREFTIDAWVLNQGRVGVTIDFSTQRGGLDGPPLSAVDRNENTQGAR